MVNVTELNRGPDISANAIDAASVSASESLTDASGDTHTGELADADNAVTGFEVGSLADGEFLQNNNGSLTGGTADTEPNQPDYELIETISVTDTVQPTITLDSTYNHVKILIDSFDTRGNSGRPGIIINGTTTSNYDSIKKDGSIFSDGPAWRFTDEFDTAHEIQGEVWLSGRWEYFAMFAANISSSLAMGSVYEGGRMTDATSPLDSITFVQQLQDTSMDLNASVYGK